MKPNFLQAISKGKTKGISPSDDVIKEFSKKDKSKKKSLFEKKK